MRSRSLALVAAAASLVVLPLLAGCSVPVAGVTGVSVNAAGQPVAVVAVCKASIDTVVLELGSDTAGRWTASPPVTTQSSLPVARPSSGWTTEQAAGRLETGQVYTLRGGTKNHSHSARPVDFTTDTLAALKPTEVVYDTGASSRPSLIKTLVTNFRAEGCATLD